MSCRGKALTQQEFYPAVVCAMQAGVIELWKKFKNILDKLF